MLHRSLAVALLLSALLPACGGDDDSSGGSGGDLAAGDAGAGGGGAGGAGTGGSGTGVDEGPLPVLPAAPAECPVLANGRQKVLGKNVLFFVGERREDVKGPILFYWHGTGSVAEEASAFMAAQIAEVVAEGGVVASFDETFGSPEQTGPFVWWSDDYQLTDAIVACATEQLNIDVRRIYTAGCSAGGLQSSQMVYRRSEYLAGAMPNSGGAAVEGVLSDPSHVPAVMLTHGAPGADVVVIDFSTTSDFFTRDIAAKGGFAVKCNHGGGHCGAPPEVVAAQWQFLKDHPFGYQEEPYAAGLPASFPSYCEIIR